MELYFLRAKRCATIYISGGWSSRRGEGAGLRGLRTGLAGAQRCANSLFFLESCIVFQDGGDVGCIKNTFESKAYHSNPVGVRTG